MMLCTKKTQSERRAAYLATDSTPQRTPATVAGCRRTADSNALRLPLAEGKGEKS